MGFQVEDGGGSGRKTKVNRENELRVYATTVSKEHFTNHIRGEAFSVTFSQSPTAGDDCIFYLENTSESKDLIVEGFDLGFINAGAVDAEFYVQIKDTGTRNSATTLTPVALNTGSGIAADATAEHGADLDGGAATLSGGLEIYRYVFANVQDRVTSHINFNQDVVLSANQTMTFWASDASATYYINVDFHFDAGVDN